MEKSANAQADPLILRLAKPLSVTIYQFLVLFSFRFLAYFKDFWGVFSIARKRINYALLRLKKSLIRILIYRGSYFKHSPRLGLTAVMSTTAFSLIVMPVIQPLQTTVQASKTISTSVKSPTGMVLADTPIMSTEKTSKSLRSEVTTHVVEGGETLSSIAETYLVSVDGLKYVNNLASDLLRPGEELTIPPVGGLIHSVKNGDTLASVSSLYNVPTQAIADFNALEEPFMLHEGDELVIPDAQIPQPKPVAPVYVATVQPAPGLILESTVSNLGTGLFIMPTTAVISQYFWWGHPAIDLANSCGTPILAADSGTITFAGWWAGGGGNSIWVDHGNGYVTKYAHMSGFERTGGTVNRGDVIGYMGTTGRSTGCHLHFEVHYGNTSVDPLSVL